MLFPDSIEIFNLLNQSYKVAIEFEFSLYTGLFCNGCGQCPHCFQMLSVSGICRMDVKVRSFFAVFLGLEQQIAVPALHVAGLLTYVVEKIGIVYSMVTSTRLL